ncbi:hypothetical protein NEOLEDRAFT_1189403 [Neolentinus lepideus HHB14362 ss-1]|uniref:Uncharacterized protein n=1 Tax=Neolentinus lepideus HHB14362 ss-1 TaxID=1314782 RepID=A0A165MVS2_9AGAM|nr:hypothetical protein NEOLEDRAFT_1189403 [Neolentinus lepideus HHB14362 ss-1]
MASHLEAHRDHLATALRDHEAGRHSMRNIYKKMNRNTEELPCIIAELENNVSTIERSHEQLQRVKATSQEHFSYHRGILDDFDELGEIMADMLLHQEKIEVSHISFSVRLSPHCCGHRQTAYQFSYNELLIELARLRKYREAA